MGEEATDPVVMEALEWFVRMRDDAVSTADRQALEAWLAASPDHVVAWRRAEALWRSLDVVKPELDRLRPSREALSRRNLLFGSAALLGGLGGLYAYTRSDLFAEYRTDIGERRTFTLPDGSSVELGSYSALSTRFTETRRQVALLRGQGFFDVAPDPLRPFQVQASTGASQALGTKFDVKYVGDLVTVAVIEHAVDVSTSEVSNTRLQAGWQVSYGQEGLGAPLPANLEVVGAWRRGRILFQDVPLRRVLAELERYRRGRIVLADSRIGDTPVTAIFNSSEADSALQTIADTLPIQVINVAGYIAIVYPRG